MNEKFKIIHLDKNKKTINDLEVFNNQIKSIVFELMKTKIKINST